MKANDSGVNRGLWRFGTLANGAYPLADGRLIDSFGYTNLNTGAFYPNPLNVFTNYHLLDVSATNGSYIMKINTTLQRSTNNIVFGVTPSPNLGLGSAYFGGDVAELILFTNILSSGEQTTVTKYLTNKFGLSW